METFVFVKIIVEIYVDIYVALIFLSDVLIYGI